MARPKLLGKGVLSKHSLLVVLGLVLDQAEVDKGELDFFLFTRFITPHNFLRSRQGNYPYFLKIRVLTLIFSFNFSLDEKNELILRSQGKINVLEVSLELTKLKISFFLFEACFRGTLICSVARKRSVVKVPG